MKFPIVEDNFLKYWCLLHIKDVLEQMFENSVILEQVNWFSITIEMN